MRTQETLLALALTTASQLSVPAGIAGNNIIIHAEARQWTDAAVIEPRPPVTERRANGLSFEPNMVVDLNSLIARTISQYEREDRLAEAFGYLAPHDEPINVTFAHRVDETALSYWKATAFVTDGLDDDFGDDWE